MDFTIDYAPGVIEDIRDLPAGIRKEILDKIDEQLQHEPTRTTRNRKLLPGIKPPWESAFPVWELRVREYRVYYDVDDGNKQVVVRAVRWKPPHKTTEEVL